MRLPSTEDGVFVAVDLGASSGRVVAARVSPSTVSLTEVARFPNIPVEAAGVLHWDILALYREVLDGIGAAHRHAGGLTSVGIDSWAIDYGLLDASGALLGNPVHYRDARTTGVMERLLAEMPADELYAATGIQPLPFNTLYQLCADAGSPAMCAAETLLLIPDLLTYWLTGEVGAEVTNASTTQLFDVSAGNWSEEVAGRFGIPARILPPLRRPGECAGTLQPATQHQTLVPDPVPVIAVGSHDTASAVVAVPMTSGNAAYISCGTWSLVGVELDSPVLTPESRLAGFTNELGVDGRIRYLRNVMGLWLLQESMRTWSVSGSHIGIEELLRAAAVAPRFRSLIDVDDRRFLPPGDMPARIAEACAAAGEPVPRDPAETTRCILDSLALAYRKAVRSAAALADLDIEVVHIVGGGSRNEMLCQLTADACGLPVVAGPMEASALGNALVQARAAGVLSGGLRELRTFIPRSFPLQRYRPANQTGEWEAAVLRVEGDSAESTTFRARA